MEVLYLIIIAHIIGVKQRHSITIKNYIIYTHAYKQLTFLFKKYDTFFF